MKTDVLEAAVVVVVIVGALILVCIAWIDSDRRPWR